MVSRELKITRPNAKTIVYLIGVAALCILHLFAGLACASTDPPPIPSSPDSAIPWWVWPLVLFVVTFFLRIVAVLGGVGGGVLFVSIVGGFLPVHIAFPTGAALIVALAEANAAGTGHQKKAMANSTLAL